MKKYISYIDYKNTNQISKRKKHLWLKENGYLHSGSSPRYLSAWEELSREFGFNFTVKSQNNKQIIEVNNMPSLHGNHVSLEFLIKIKKGLISVTLDEKLSEELNTILKKIQRIHFSGLPNYSYHDLVEFCKMISTKQRIDFILPVCPDWSYDPTKLNYTFEKLNDGIGLVAQKALRSTKDLINIFLPDQENFYFHFIIGDSMGLNPDQIKAANVKDFTEFKKLCISSQKKIETELSSFLNTNHFTVDLMSDLLSKELSLDGYTKLLEDLFKNFDLEKCYKTFKTKKNFETQLKSRAPLYEKIYKQTDMDVIQQIYIKHLIEYNILASLFKNFGKNNVILGFDAKGMQLGYKMHDTNLCVLSFQKH
ncbi:MAG: hypothetical protein FJZ57_02155 [Chlamydiae bacterium]|nr:hypothetical protein [Chlamydiota bacterium]